MIEYELTYIFNNQSIMKDELIFVSNKMIRIHVHFCLLCPVLSFCVFLEKLKIIPAHNRLLINTIQQKKMQQHLHCEDGYN